MKNQKIKILFFHTFIIFIAAFISCDLQNNNLLQLSIEEKPQFTITDMEYKEQHSYADSYLPEGVYFTFENQSSKKIILIESRLLLCDKKTLEPVFEKKGYMTFSFDGNLNSKEKKEFCIPLSDYSLSKEGGQPYVDTFYISKIIYSDTSVWSDYLGSYAIRGGQNEN